MNFTDAQLNDINRLFNQIQSEIYGLDTVELEGASLVPAETGIGQWVKSFTYKVATALGCAKLISDYSDEFPPISRAMKLITGVIKEFGVSYSFSEPELMQWLTAGIDLSRDEAETARETIEAYNDEIILKGNTEGDLPGFINNPNVSTISAGTAAAGGTAWSSKTLKEIQADVQTLIDTVRTASKRTVKIDTIALPHSAYVHVATEKIGSDSGSATILDYLLKTYSKQGITDIVECSALDGAGGSSADRAIGYKKDRKCLAYVLPIPFRQMSAQVKGIKFTTPCYCRAGGTIIKNLASIVYMDGV